MLWCNSSLDYIRSSENKRTVQEENWKLKGAERQRESENEG